VINKEELKHHLVSQYITKQHKEKENMSKIGKVKWFNGTKGFGFIAVDGDEKDIFVHISAVKDSGIDSLVEGDTIEFEVEDGNKGPVAVQLKKQ
jgi:CspA family cold shock protein